MTSLGNFCTFESEILTYMMGTEFVRVRYVFELLFPTNETDLLVFLVYYERPMPMVIDSLNLKLRQIVRFSSNVILEEMSSAK